MAEKKTKQLTATRDAYFAAFDVVVRQWLIANKDIKEWVKETRKAVKDYESALSAYQGEIDDYTDNGTKQYDYSHPANQRWLDWAHGKLKGEEEPEREPGEWVDRMNEKYQILDNDMSIGSLEELLDEMKNMFDEHKKNMDDFVKDGKAIRKMTDPTDIE